MSFRSGYGQKCAIELYRDATERQAKLAVAQGGSGAFSAATIAPVEPPQQGSVPASADVH